MGAKSLSTGPKQESIELPQGKLLPNSHIDSDSLGLTPTHAQDTTHIGSNTGGDKSGFEKSGHLAGRAASNQNNDNK